MRLGFFGLGEMGANIALRLLDCNQEIYSVKRGNFHQFKNKKNFFFEENPKEIANQVDGIILCIDTKENLQEIIYSEDGILNSSNKPSFILDLSTGLPSFIKKIHDDLKKVNISYIDSPIGRTPQHALEGKLNLFVSCKESQIDQNQLNLLDMISENRFFFDNISDGTKLKLLNNFYGQYTTLIFGETLSINNKNFESPDDLLRIMSAGPLYSPILDAIKPYYDDSNNGSMLFSIENALKDLKYFKEDFLTEENALVDLIIGKFEKAVKNGFGQESVAKVASYVD
jgi:2-hydroxy-3-oxopropionate reductase